MIHSKTRRRRTGPIVFSGVAYSSAIPSGLNRFTAAAWRALLDGGVEGIVGFGSDGGLIGASPYNVRDVGKKLWRTDSAGNLRRLAWHQAALPSLLRGLDARGFFSPVPEGMLRPPCPQAITIHDLIPLHVPEAAPRLRYLYRHVIPRIAKQCVLVVTVSESSAAELAEWRDLSGVPIRVLYQPYREDVFMPRPVQQQQEVRIRHGLAREFILGLGDLRPYKNTGRLVEAFALVRERPLDLAIVGGDDVRRAFEPVAREMGVSGRVRFIGRVSDDDLARLYSAAQAFVFPSRYEGFGIPPLEAFASGCPVVASPIPAIREVGGEAALYADPDRPEEIAAAVERVLTDRELRDRLRGRGLDRATRFRSDHTAKRLRELLTELVS